MDPFEGAFERFGDRAALIEAVNDEALARAIHRAVGGDALAWLDRPVPALGGRRPRACLRSQEGRRDLRRVLARFP